MKKYYFLIVLVLILGLVLTGCSLLSNISQVPATEQSEIAYLTKGGPTEDEASEVKLLASQNIEVGVVKVWNDTENLYVKYMVDAPWCLSETHVHVGVSLTDFPLAGKQKNPIPGQFDYSESHDCVTEYIYVIPLNDGPWDFEEVFIAAHAVVKKETITFDTCMIDFEEFSEYDDVSSVPTDCGEVTFCMVDYTPLIGLSIGETATLTVKDDLPVIAEENTMGLDYYGLVAFTSQLNGMKDDLVLNDSGTGAGGKMLTDALDYSQTPLLYHAYTKYQAILVNVSNVLNVDTLNFVGIDLDHNELWHFQYFDENDVLIADVTVGPGTVAGDGKAYPTYFTDPRIFKVAIWGEQNQLVPDRLGFAIDNIEVTTKTITVQEETAWGDGSRFTTQGNWATYFEYTISEPCIEPDGSLSITGTGWKSIGDWCPCNYIEDLTATGEPVALRGYIDTSGAAVANTSDWSKYYAKFSIIDIDGNKVEVVFGNDWLGNWYEMPAQQWDRIRMENNMGLSQPQQYYATVGGVLGYNMSGTWVGTGNGATVYPSDKEYFFQLIADPAAKTFTLQVLAKGSSAPASPPAAWPKQNMYDEAKWLEIGTIYVGDSFNFAKVTPCAILWASTQAGVTETSTVSWSEIEIDAPEIW